MPLVNKYMYKAISLMDHQIMFQFAYWFIFLPDPFYSAAMCKSVGLWFNTPIGSNFVRENRGII